MSAFNNAKALPTTFISKTVMNERIQNYVAHKLPLLSGAIGKGDTTSGWYSLAQFEELVREMYYQNADGLRVYFAAYDDKDPNYANQLTVVFVPTFLNTATGEHQDIVLDDKADFGERMQVPTDKMNIDTLALCPPFCPKP
jgi:hypothetical protein